MEVSNPGVIRGYDIIYDRLKAPISHPFHGFISLAIMSLEPSSIGGLDEDLLVTHHHECVHSLFPFFNLDSPVFHPSVYPSIDPRPLYAAQSYGGKVVLITGASRGIGRETALQYARAGASVAIVARTGDALNETKDIIVAAVPSADVFALTADVRDVESVRNAVEGVVRHFGKLDILIANAGAITLFTPGEYRRLQTTVPSFPLPISRLLGT
jgi:short subunit dehydrogenase